MIKGKQQIRKRIIVMLLMVLISLGISAQKEIEKLRYTYYTAWFSTTEHIPLVVHYTLTAEMLSCSDPIARSNKFKADPNHKALTNLAKDYRNSGYDRGHNMNAADNKCSEVGMKECFYYSNMTPQPHSFNAGRWEELEEQERTEANHYQTIIITCGSVGASEHIGPDKVAVPKWMWKVIYIPTKKEYQCYIFPNTNEVTQPLDCYLSTLSQIEKLAAVNFTEGLVVLKVE